MAFSDCKCGGERQEFARNCRACCSIGDCAVSALFVWKLSCWPCGLFALLFLRRNCVGRGNADSRCNQIANQAICMAHTRRARHPPSCKACRSSQPHAHQNLKRKKEESLLIFPRTRLQTLLPKSTLTTQSLPLHLCVWRRRDATIFEFCFKVTSFDFEETTNI